MALVLADRVQETTTTSGTGTLTLGGALSGYRTFSSGIGNGNTTYYCIYDQTAQVWEIGLGTVGSGTLARTTVYSNSSGDTSPISLAGNTASVFAVYTASKTVNLDASGNVTALGNVTSGTWQGTTVGVAYGGTGVTSSSGANSVVLRDANSNVTFNNFTANAASTVAAAGTTVLTVSSARTQILTGATTQTYQLPNATTLAVGQSFLFINLSSGVLTVKDNASTTVESIPSGGITQLGALSIATSAGSWGAYSFLPGSYDFNNSTADFGTATIQNATWHGGTIASGYGGTGLTTFTAANNALYSTSSSALTAGTLPVTAGGTGQTSFSSGYIPYGNSSAALQSSSLLQFNGSYLQVGGGSTLGGTTNPIAAFTQSANGYVQTYIYNASTGGSGSSDFVAYTDNSTDAHGWADIGYTSSTYNDASYSVTGPNEAYVLGSAPSGAGKTGNLVYATDSTGTANAHQWYIGGFNQAKGAWKMQLTSTGLQLANALAVSYGGLGITTTPSNGQIPIGNGTNYTAATITAGTGISVTNSSGGITITNTSPSSGGTVTSVTGTAPISSSGGTTPAISIAQATSLANGYLSSTDWSTFNGKQAALVSGTNIKTVNSTSLLGSGDVSVGVTSVTGTAPISSSGGATPAISIAQATTSTSGYLSSTDWNTFNNKQPAGSYLTSAVTSAVAGTGISVSGATGAVTFTNSGVTSAVAGTGVTVSGSTGAVAFSIGQAVATGSNVQFNSLGVGTAGSGTAGEIRATNNVTAYYSDERLKTKIGNIENALEKVKQIETMYYHANETAVDLGYDASVIEVGVTAQSVQRVMPQTVAPAPIDDKYLTVRYERLVPLLIEAIKELEEKVRILESK
jgi:hypothetical protein